MEKRFIYLAAVLILAVILTAPAVSAQDMRNDATDYTIKINTAENLEETWQNLADDYEFANRGLLAEVSPVIIKNSEGKAVIDTSKFTFLNNKTAPLTIQNSLFQHAKLTRSAAQKPQKPHTIW